MKARDKSYLKRGVLPRRTYLAVLKAIPVVTLDLIVRNHKRQILLGRRKNEPARNSWFVPGGRLFKNERLHSGLNRIFETELGIVPVFKEPKLWGVFEMFFDSNFAGVKGVTTHNVSLAYEFKVGSSLTKRVFQENQHSDYRWFSLEELMSSREVHSAVKAYFIRRTQGKRP